MAAFAQDSTRRPLAPAARSAFSLALAAAALLPASPVLAQAPADTAHAVEPLRIEVGRLRADGVPIDRLPFGAQVLRLDHRAAAGLTVADALVELVGITGASQFGSPVQPDLRFRGFQVGPVVGFPQSVSVFVDGVRVNEPDAAQVNFDLIPLSAVQRVEVIRTPGGPFGRNTLAGAINFVTRGGLGNGDRVRASAKLAGGSFGTLEAQGSVAGAGPGNLRYFLSGRLLESEGWRDLSSTRLRQGFAKLGFDGAPLDAWLSYTFADNRVEGPGSLPSSWLAGRLPAELAGTEDPRELQFTGFQGDFFEPALHFVVLNARRSLRDGVSLQLNGFFRSNDVVQFNDNITEPNVRGETGMRSGGATLQVGGTTASGIAWGAGVEYVRNATRILILEEPNPAFPEAGGVTERVRSTEDAAAAFTHAWWPLTERIGLTGSLRFDYVSVPVVDELDPENSGENTFRQLTGAFGADYRLSRSLSAFAGYGRGFRTPVILELSCADPEDPCPLPFELGADPPLDPVRSDAWQAGLRYAGPVISGDLVGYWAEVHDDLFNVVLPPSTRGYFRNLDRTRRQGVELGLEARPIPDLALRGTLHLARATFQSEATLASALLVDDEDGDPGEGDGAVRVAPGDRFAMTPAVSIGLEAEYATGDWRLGVGGSYVGEQYFVGDEDNRGDFGRLGSYLLLDGRVERSFDDVRVYLVGENLLDDEHETFGIISPNVRGPDEEPQPFLSPGLPLRLTAGLAWRTP